GLAYASGVMLEPAGAEFVLPVTLQAAAADGTSFDVVSAAEDGSNVEPTHRIARASGSTTVELLHFSPHGRTIGPIPDSLYFGISDADEAELERVLNDNSNPLFPTPIPFASDTCHDPSW